MRLRDIWKCSGDTTETPALFSEHKHERWEGAADNRGGGDTEPLKKREQVGQAEDLLRIGDLIRQTNSLSTLHIFLDIKATELKRIDCCRRRDVKIKIKTSNN